MRFEINEKSSVVMFGMRSPPRNCVFTLGDEEIKITDTYKYLGIEFTRTLRWNKYTKRILEKSRRNMMKSWGMGISGGFMRTKTSELVYKSLVRSILEYGCEVWGGGEFDDFEKVQTDMGRKILRCGPRMNNEVVRGELGWGTLKGRRDEMRLRYWGKITQMKNERIPKIIYRESRKRMEEEEKKGEIKTKTWCKYTRDLLRELWCGETK